MSGLLGFAVTKALATKAAVLLPAVNVSLGFEGVTDPGDYLWVGVENPYSAALTPAVSETQEWAGSPRQTGRNASGDVFCCVESWNGEGDIPAAIDSANAIFETFTEWVRTSDRADVPGLFTAAASSMSGDLAHTTTGEGVARIVFSIHYEGRI